MTWEEICADPLLADLPYRIESDRWGNIVMGPLTAQHSDAQGQIIALLSDHLPGGHAQPACPLQTSEGVKVIDAVWISRQRRRQRSTDALVYLAAPEICVEVRTPSDPYRMIVEKMDLYFEKGAQECWVCDKSGRLTFYHSEGPLSRSVLCPDFPATLPED